MRHFFTKQTVEAMIWCTPCHKETLWKIAGGRPQYCTECYDSKRSGKTSGGSTDGKGEMGGDLPGASRQASLFGDK